MVFSQSVSPGQARGWINEHKFQTQRERGKEKFTLNLKFHTKCIFILYTCLQLGPGEASCILLRFYMTTWLDYNVPI